MSLKILFQRLVLAGTILSLAACAQPAPIPATQTSLPSPAASPTAALPLPTFTPPPPPLTYQEALPMYAYDPTIPFDLQVKSTQDQDGVTVQDLSYAAANPQFTAKTAGRIAAYLVTPDGEAPFAGILFMHGLGSGWGKREEFIDEAKQLARQGVISLLPQGIVPWLEPFSGDGLADQELIIKQVVELRRSLDLLLSQPGLDPQRLAFVGHDYGAMHGALLSGLEQRIKAYVLMAGDSSFSTWTIKYFARPADETAFRAFMDAVDPVSYLPHAAPAVLFFQFGGKDGYVPKQSADETFSAASDPKQLAWYEQAGHTLNDQARQDRLAWLAAQLALLPAQN